MKTGECGTRSFNIELQKILNPNYKRGIERFDQIYSVKDKVMQTINNYDKGIYNGDIGYIIAIDKEDQKIRIDFSGREVIYEYSELEEIVLCYAMTIHKSQGSEYPVIIIPVITQHYMMLQKNLLYTAITRAKQLAIVIGQKQAIKIAVNNRTVAARHTKLKDWLKWKIFFLGVIGRV